MGTLPICNSYLPIHARRPKLQMGRLVLQMGTVPICEVLTRKWFSFTDGQMGKVSW